MARRRPPADAPVPPEVEALDSVRHGWYAMLRRRGVPHPRALREAQAYVPARERLRAVDPHRGRPR